MSDNINNSGFFAINRASFHKACSVGLNEAVSYLVLARGTGRDHSKSSWSVQAIETYTGISRPRAHLAIQGLISSGNIQKDKGGTRPRYSILHEKNTDLEWIWLPNTLVTGASSETPPIEIVRQTQDIVVLCLLIDMYFSQNLRADGGMHWRILRQDWKRIRVGEYGPFVVWGFTQNTATAWLNASFIVPHIRGNKNGKQSEIDNWDKSLKEFWGRWNILMRLGLVEYVGHLIESDTDTAEIIHPYATAGGELIERELAQVANNAGLSMLTEKQIEWATRELGGMPWLVPVASHFKEVQLVGIPRLRYRPHTKLTAAWFANTITSCSDYKTRYQAMLSYQQNNKSYSATSR